MTERIFWGSVATLLLLTGGIKLIASAGHAPSLAEKDSVLWFLSTRQVVLIAANIEVLGACLILSGKRQWFWPFMLAYMSTAFALYRAVHGLVSPELPCPCLGGELLFGRLDPARLESGMKVLLLYFLFGSYFLLAKQFINGRRTALSNPPLIRQ